MIIIFRFNLSTHWEEEEVEEEEDDVSIVVARQITHETDKREQSYKSQYCFCADNLLKKSSVLKGFVWRMENRFCVVVTGIFHHFELSFVSRNILSWASERMDCLVFFS